ncbi:MAG: PorT family protein [Gemmatimonadota bacterium]|nr:PorT family protein [Gemmatimonadota bacterium]MDH5759963.1 PorT family protein [Gemmatimonadota bacterium]
MKKYIWTFMALLVAAVPASGQTIFVRGGLNMTTLGGADVVDASSRTGTNLGAAVVFPMGGASLDLGLAWSTRGAKMTEGTTELDFALGYLEVPVLFRFGPASSGSAAFHVAVGPTLGFNMGCTMSATGVEIDCGSGSQFDLNIAGMDFGLTGGAGVDVQAGSMVVGIDALYTFGMKTIDGDTQGTGGIEDIKNRGFTLSVGLGFPMK